MSPLPKASVLLQGIQAILFDMDGTLVDTEPIGALAIEQVLAQWKIPLKPNEREEWVGKSWPAIFDCIVSKRPLPLEPKELEQIIEAHYLKLIREHLPILPGAVRAIDTTAKRFRLGLVSGSSQEQIDQVLQTLDRGSSFEMALGIETYEKSKPDPAGFLLGAERMKLAPQACLVVEDSVPGILAARAADMRVLAIEAANSTKQDLSQADACFPTLNEFADWIA